MLVVGGPRVSSRILHLQLVSIGGQRYATVVTPRLQAVARSQFHCEDLLGARLLENDSNTASYYGEVW